MHCHWIYIRLDASLLPGDAFQGLHQLIRKGSRPVSLEDREVIVSLQ